MELAGTRSVGRPTGSRIATGYGYDCRACERTRVELLLNSLKQTGSLIETPLRSGDKRRAARYGAQLPVRYRWTDGKAWFNGMTVNISATGLLFALDSAGSRIVRDCPAPPDDLLGLAIELRTPPPLPASISCSARHVRTMVAPGRVALSAIGVVVDRWQLGRAPAGQSHSPTALLEEIASPGHLRGHA